MCTVSYIPLTDGGFVFTSNRDESPKRSPKGLHKENNLLLPKEPKHGGTWICVSKQQRLVCLMNGAFEKHKHEPPYRRSRGLVVLDCFEYDSINHFFEDYSLGEIEPFAMFVYDKGQLYDFRWDEKEKHLRILDTTKPYLWSSAALYDANAKTLRQAWFSDWLNTHPPEQRNQTAILDFHHNAGNGDLENNLLMKRYGGLVQTVSITSIQKTANCFEMRYKDLVHGKKDSKLIYWD